MLWGDWRWVIVTAHLISVTNVKRLVWYSFSISQYLWIIFSLCHCLINSLQNNDTIDMTDAIPMNMNTIVRSTVIVDNIDSFCRTGNAILVNENSRTRSSDQQRPWTRVCLLWTRSKKTEKYWTFHSHQYCLSVIFYQCYRPQSTSFLYNTSLGSTSFRPIAFYFAPFVCVFTKYCDRYDPNKN